MLPPPPGLFVPCGAETGGRPPRSRVPGRSTFPFETCRKNRPTGNGSGYILWTMRLLRLTLLLTWLTAAFAQEPFALRDGDRVVFYGDSITDQRLYTTFTETYVVTRFPKLDASFVHSGWGGDRVTGGGGGPIDVRLRRDVYAYKPTVMTIMLGMNDASYRPFDQNIFNTYANGYQKIISDVKKEIPGIRITVIQPSPFDD